MDSLRGFYIQNLLPLTAESLRSPAPERNYSGEEDMTDSPSSSSINKLSTQLSDFIRLISTCHLVELEGTSPSCTALSGNPVLS